MKKRIIECFMLSLLFITILYPSIKKTNPPNKYEKEIEEAGICSNDFTKKTSKEYYNGYVITSVNVRDMPTTNSNVIGMLLFNEMITYSLYNDNWIEIEYNGSKAYVCNDYISDNFCDYNSYTNFPNIYKKTYMSYTSITSKSSKQYELKQYTYSGNYGIRMIDNRYCIAMGTGFNVEIGDYVDLILANGTIIQCIIGDIKADKHTDSSNMITMNSKCMSEFIITSKSSIPSIVGDSEYGSGDISDCCEEWKSCIHEIRVYNKNYLKDE